MKVYSIWCRSRVSLTIVVVFLLSIGNVLGSNLKIKTEQEEMRQSDFLRVAEMQLIQRRN